MPDNAVNLTNLRILYEGIGKKDIAKKYYESALKIDPNSAFALNNLAFLIAETNGDLDVALTYAQRAKQRLPNYSEITDTLGLIYIKKNLTDSAIDTFKGLVVQAPQNPVFHCFTTTPWRSTRKATANPRRKSAWPHWPTGRTRLRKPISGS